MKPTISRRAGLPGRLIINATVGSPSSYDSAVIGSRLSSATRDPDGEFTANGAAVNSLGREIDDVRWWVVLYDAGGRLLNVATEFDFLYPDGLGPGGQTPFEATIYSGSDLLLHREVGGHPGSKANPGEAISLLRHGKRHRAGDDPTDAPTHHRGISANTPQPRYSRVYAA